MIVFNCTVKDIFRRPYMIDSAVRTLANNGYAEHAVTYSRIRDNIKNAMEYASSNMRDYEYKAAVIYLQSRESEQEIANTAYYYEVMGIKLLPVDTRYIDCVTSSGTFWDKVNSLMDTSIENALVAIVYFNEHKSINHICSTYRMGSDKVKRIIDSFGSVVTLYDIPSEKRSAV